MIQVMRGCYIFNENVVKLLSQKYSTKFFFKHLLQKVISVFKKSANHVFVAIKFHDKDYELLLNLWGG